jgi:hypothetical protein
MEKLALLAKFAWKRVSDISTFVWVVGLFVTPSAVGIVVAVLAGMVEHQPWWWLILLGLYAALLMSLCIGIPVGLWIYWQNRKLLREAKAEFLPVLHDRMDLHAAAHENRLMHLQGRMTTAEEVTGKWADAIDARKRFETARRTMADMQSYLARLIALADGIQDGNVPGNWTNNVQSGEAMHDHIDGALRHFGIAVEWKTPAAFVQNPARPCPVECGLEGKPEQVLTDIRRVYHQAQAINAQLEPIAQQAQAAHATMRGALWQALNPIEEDHD